MFGQALPDIGVKRIANHWSEAEQFRIVLPPLALTPRFQRADSVTVGVIQRVVDQEIVGKTVVPLPIQGEEPVHELEQRLLSNAADEEAGPPAVRNIEERWIGIAAAGEERAGITRRIQRSDGIQRCVHPQTAMQLQKVEPQDVRKMRDGDFPLSQLAEGVIRKIRIFAHIVFCDDVDIAIGCVAFDRVHARIHSGRR